MSEHAKMHEQRNQLLAAARRDVDTEWQALEERQAEDTAVRNAAVRAHREEEARRDALRKARALTEPDSGAGSGNTEGDVVAVASPSKKKSADKAKSGDKAEPSTTGAVTGQFKEITDRALARNAEALEKSRNGKAANRGGAAKPKARSARLPSGADGAGPSLPDNKQVFVRHMRNPRDAYILIKNTSVFSNDANWAVKDEFKTKEDAVAWAEKHNLKVMNK